VNSDTYAIIPVYNEASAVGDVIKTVKKTYKNVVCVDDGSRDNSSQAISSSGAILLRHSINLGAGAATQTGIDYALMDPKAKYFITIDADGQHDIKDAQQMLEYLIKNNLDIVLGSRFLGTAQNISTIKRLFLKLAAMFSEGTSGVVLSDPHVGLRVFNRRFAESLKLTMPGFAHASELIHRIGENNFKYAELPISVTYSDYSKAKGQSMMNAVNITVDLFHHRISKK